MRPVTLAMADSIYIANLPAGFPAFAGYVDGTWQTAPGLKARFPSAHILTIAVFASDDADCCDCEKGDLTPAQVPSWVKRQMARGAVLPCVYASAANIPAILSALTTAGIKRAQVRIWSAHYGLGPHICGPATCKYPGVPACDGTQFTDLAPGAHGSLIDQSLLLGTFFGGIPMSLNGPEHWDAADFAALDTYLGRLPTRDITWHAGMWWLQHAVTGTTSKSMPANVAAQVTAIHDGLVALASASAPPTAAQVAAAVVAALPPSAAGGLTQADVEAAVQAVFLRAGTAPAA